MGKAGGVDGGGRDERMKSKKGRPYGGPIHRSKSKTSVSRTHILCVLRRVRQSGRRYVVARFLKYRSGRPSDSLPTPNPPHPPHRRYSARARQFKQRVFSTPAANERFARQKERLVVRAVNPPAVSPSAPSPSSSSSSCGSHLSPHPSPHPGSLPSDAGPVA